jgi:hypothetical protein
MCTSMYLRPLCDVEIKKLLMLAGARVALEFVGAIFVCPLHGQIGNVLLVELSAAIRLSAGRNLLLSLTTLITAMRCERGMEADCRRLNH